MQKTVELNYSGDYDTINKDKETVPWLIEDPVINISCPMKQPQLFEKKVAYRFKIYPICNLSYMDNFENNHLEIGDYFVIINNQK